MIFDVFRQTGVIRVMIGSRSTLKGAEALARRYALAGVQAERWNGGRETRYGDIIVAQRQSMQIIPGVVACDDPETD